jgi:transposase-like protein
VHRIANIVVKLTDLGELRTQVRAAYWAALDEASDADDAERRLRALIGQLEREYPSAAACLADDLPALCAHLRYPLRLRRRLRSSNLLERSLEEVQRRVKVIGRFPGETSCLSLTWAVLDLFSTGAHGLGLSELDLQQLERLREERSRTSEPLAESA